MSRAVGRRWFLPQLREITPPAAQRLGDLVGQPGRPEGNWPLEVEQLQKQSVSFNLFYSTLGVVHILHNHFRGSRETPPHVIL